jgi:hypothetical protein
MGLKMKIEVVYMVGILALWTLSLIAIALNRSMKVAIGSGGISITIEKAQ